MARFDGKLALVTGAASGIGRATALGLAAEGARVFGVDVDAEGLVETAALAAEAGGRLEWGCHDLSRRAGCVAAVAAAHDVAGRLDVVANVAGMHRFHHFTEMPEEDWQRMLAINLSAVAFVCQAAIPHLLETSGCIVNVASVAALKGQAYTAAYCVSKAGVVQLTRSLAMEYVETGLRVNAVAPGGIDTPMTANLEWPENLNWDLIKPFVGRRGLGTADDVATAIAFLASDQARLVHGAVLTLDGGMTAG